MSLFEKAYIEKAERRDYLKGLMEKAFITKPNYMLARLLAKKKDFANLIITVNFDDLLSKALTLFGENPLVIDYPDYIERMLASPEGSIKIVHIHGSYRFYDCKNLRGEIFPHETDNILGDDAPRQYYKSIYGYLLAVLAKSVPIVIGYSGWNDVIATAIKQRLKSMMGYHCYWFCYNEKDYDNLSQEIKNSENVFVVVNNTAARVPKTVKEYDKDNKDKKFNLPAEKVFDELILQLETDDIDLLNNPFEHYKKILENLLPKGDSDTKTSSLYNFNNAIEWLAEASQDLERKRQTVLEGTDVSAAPVDISLDDAGLETRATEETQRVDLIINEVYSLGRTGKKVDALNKICDYFISNDSFTNLAEKQKNDITRSVHLLSGNISVDDLNDVLRAFNKIISYAKDCSRDSDFWSTVIHERAKILYDLGKTEDAIKEHENLISKFGESFTEKTIDNILRSAYALGWVYDNIKDYEKANQIYKDIIKKYESRVPTLSKSAKVTFANAYLSIGRNYQSSRIKEKPNEGIKFLNDGIAAFKNESLLDVRRVVDKMEKEIVKLQKQ